MGAGNETWVPWKSHVSSPWMPIIMQSRLNIVEETMTGDGEGKIQISADPKLES